MEFIEKTVGAYLFGPLWICLNNCYYILPDISHKTTLREQRTQSYTYVNFFSNRFETFL